MVQYTNRGWVLVWLEPYDWIIVFSFVSSGSSGPQLSQKSNFLWRYLPSVNSPETDTTVTPRPGGFF